MRGQLDTCMQRECTTHVATTGDGIEFRLRIGLTNTLQHIVAK